MFISAHSTMACQQKVKKSMGSSMGQLHAMHQFQENVGRDYIILTYFYPSNVHVASITVQN